MGTVIDGRAMDLMKKEYCDILRSCGKLVGEKELKEAANAVISARAVLCAGSGGAAGAALALSEELVGMGLLGVCEADVYLASMLISSRGPEDVLVLFCGGTPTRDDIQALQLGRASGMQTLLLSCVKKSPLAVYADRMLCAPMALEPAEERIALLFLAQILAEEVRRSDHKFDSALARSSWALAKKI